MDLISKICEVFIDFDAEECYSLEFLEQSQKCNEMMETLRQSLSEHEKSKLLTLESELLHLCSLGMASSHKQGCQKGFKLSAKILLQCIK